MSHEEPDGVILDASALLALLRGETGDETVARTLTTARISVINWAEVMDVALRESIDPDSVRSLLATGMKVVPLTVSQAELAAGIRFNVRPTGVSLADCCCLALGLEHSLPVYTADSAWPDLELDVEIRLIR